MVIKCVLACLYISSQHVRAFTCYCVTDPLQDGNGKLLMRQTMEDTTTLHLLRACQVQVDLFQQLLLYNMYMYMHMSLGTVVRQNQARFMIVTIGPCMFRSSYHHAVLHM